MRVIQSKTSDKIKVSYGGIEFKEIIFVSPRVKLLLENPDALSMDLTIFKNGGKVNGEEAIPYVRVRPLESKTGDEE